MSVIGLVAMAPDSPEIVTTELLEEYKFTSHTNVTVNLFVAPATGVLCPIDLVVKLAPCTIDDCINNTSIQLIRAIYDGMFTKGKMERLSCRRSSSPKGSAVWKFAASRVDELGPL